MSKEKKGVSGTVPGIPEVEVQETRNDGRDPEFDGLNQWDKKKLIGINFTPLKFTPPYLTEYGWCRTYKAIISESQEEIIYFVELDGAQDKSKVLNTEVTMVTKVGKSGREYKTYAPPIKKE